MEEVPTAVLRAGPRRPARLLRLASDERLVALVRDGDEGAFETLFDRHHRTILGFCRHMLGSREEAEDVVQHTFLAAYRDLQRHEQAIQLRPWLFTIARNRCLSVLRARREHASLELAEPSTDGLTATVERREELRELLGDMAGLPEDQRAALLLAELGALDHAGIATVLGCPREKVKALVFQARSSLVASREARATPCEQIRTELATASGGALRRASLRRHLRTCAGCRAFKAEVATQRQLLALALPVVPSLALKAGLLSALGGSASGGVPEAALTGTTAAAGASGAATTASGVGATAAGTSGAGIASGAAGSALSGVLGTAVSTGAAKIAVSLTLAGAAVGGGALTIEAYDDGSHAPATSQQAPDRSGTARQLAPAGALVPGGAASGSPTRSSRARGFLPSRGGPGNGAEAREWARSRGHDGLGPVGTTPTSPPNGKQPGAGQAAPARGTRPLPGTPTPRAGTTAPGRSGVSPPSDPRPADAGSPATPPAASQGGSRTTPGVPAHADDAPAAGSLPPGGSVPPRGPRAPTG